MSFSSIVDGYEKFFKKYFEDFAAEHGSDSLYDMYNVVKASYKKSGEKDYDYDLLLEIAVEVLDNLIDKEDNSNEMVYSCRKW